VDRRLDAPSVFVRADRHLCGVGREESSKAALFVFALVADRPPTLALGLAP